MGAVDTALVVTARPDEKSDVGIGRLLGFCLIQFGACILHSDSVRD